jgi:hypothetical protein
VTPVASPASLSVDVSGEVWTLSGGVAFPPGFVSVSSWPDADSSETATLTFSLSAPDPSLFTLSAGGVALTPLEPGLWQISATSQAALQSILDSLTLNPPSGFTGRAELAVFGSLSDTASFPSEESTQTDTNFDLGFGVASLRFFLGGDVTLPVAVTAPEGSTLDLGGQFVATDPDTLPGDTSVLTLSVPRGLFTFSDSALVEGMTAERTIAPDGSTTITLRGDLGAINTFLAVPGSLLYSAPDPDFSGVVPLTVTLANLPGEPPSEGSEFPSEGNEFPSFAPLVIQSGEGEAPGKFGGTVALTFTPVADHVFPVANDAVTNQDTPVAVSIGIAPLPTDPSESVLIVVEGVPSGASFNRGTNLGGGAWAFSPADLNGLVFTPPPGASGVFLLSVKAVVTDTAEDGTTDIATESTAFTITVNPVAAPTPSDPVPDPILPLLPPVVETVLAGAPTGAVESSTTDVVSTDTGETGDDRPTESTDRPAVLPESFGTISSTDPGVGATEGRVGLSPGPGSLFAQPETPLPSYGGSEKHPLPPVLPLDQTSPVAGFTESGGDSFALVDKLYRDAGVAQGAELNTKTDEGVVVASARVEAADAPPPAPAAPVPTAPAEQTVAVVNTDVGVGTPASLADVSESEWRVWVAGGVVAGALAVWAWMSHAPNGRLARAIRRLLHPIHRTAPTETC